MDNTRWGSAPGWAITILAGVILTALAARRAEARWHLDIQSGAFVPTADVEFQSGSDDVDSDVGEGPAFAIGGGYGFSDWIDVTAQLQYATNFNIFDDNVDAYSFTTGVRVFPLSSAYPVHPWLGGQLGWYRIAGDFEGPFEQRVSPRLFFPHTEVISRTDDSFGINVGGGIDVPINRRVSMGVDVRYHNAFDALDGYEFLTTMLNVSIWFGDAWGGDEAGRTS